MLAQKLILSYGSKILIQMLQIAASIVVARIAGPTVLGTVAFGLAFVSMFEFLADLGIGPAHMKLVSEGRDLGTCISTYSVLKIINTAFFFCVVLAFYLVQKYLLGVHFESTAHETVILITLVAVTIYQLMYIPKITFAARTEQAKQDVPDIVRTLVYQIMRVVIVLVGYRAVALALGNLVSTIMIIPFVFYMFRSYPRARFDRKLAQRYLKTSFPIILIGMSTNMIYYLDKVVLQYFTNSEQVGYYVAGYRIGGLIFMIGTSAGLIFFPLFSKAAAGGDFKYITRTINRYERFVFLFVMPLVILASLYSGPLIDLLLGKGYGPAAPVMVLVAIAMLLSILNMPYDNLITGMGFFSLAARIHLTNLLFFATLISVLPNPRIFGLGPSGAAWTILSSCLFIGLLVRFFASKKCPGLKVTRNLHLLAFGVANFGVFHFLRVHTAARAGGFLDLIFVLVYLGVTYGTLRALGWIRKDDLGDLRQVFNVGRLVRYIRGEVSGK